jgi:hypothetical protein
MTVSEPKINLIDLGGIIVFMLVNFILAWQLGASDYLTCDRPNSETVMCMIERRHLLGLWYEKVPKFSVKDVMTFSESSRSCTEGICEDITTYNLVLLDEKNNKKLFHSYYDYDLSKFDLQRLEKFLKDPKLSKINIHQWVSSLFMNIIAFITFILTLFAPLSFLAILLNLFLQLSDLLFRLFYLLKRIIYNLINVFK